MFHPLAEYCVRRLRPQLPTHASVVEFGNQRYGGTGSFKSVRDFYQSLQCQYLALDVNEEKDAIICDLNEPARLDRQFDLVTNNGTGEHLFNQYMVFKNAHDLCHIGGWMLHILPMTPWLNHGFFNYNPILFRDLAAANHYEVGMSLIGNRAGDHVPLGEWGWIEKRPKDLITAVEELLSLDRGEVFVVSALKKTAEAFRTPLQGKYQQDVADAGLLKKYATG